MDTATTEQLCSRYATDVESLVSLGVLEACEVLLCAADLKLGSRCISTAIDRLSREEPDPSDQSEELLQGILRQLVFTRFGVYIESRKRFLDFWMNDAHYQGKDIIGVSFLVDLGIENPTLLQPRMREYVTKWYLSHRNLRSHKGRAWAVYGLAKAGHREAALVQAQVLMAERDRNGSWGGDLPRTVSCSYPLVLAGLFAPADFEQTTAYIFHKLHLGYLNNPTTRAHVLKLLYLLGQVPESQVKALRAKVRGFDPYASLSDTDMAAFRRRIAAHFSVDELQTLCFDCGINYEDFPIQIEAFSRELISYCERRGQLGRLVEACRRERPQIGWP